MNDKTIQAAEFESLLESNNHPMAIFHLAGEGEYRCAFHNQAFAHAIGHDLPAIENAKVSVLFSDRAPEVERCIQETIHFRRFSQTSCELPGGLFKIFVKPFFSEGQIGSLHLSLFPRLSQSGSLINRQTLLDSLLDAIFVFDVGDDGQFRLSYLNQSYEEGTGFLLSRNQGKTPVEMVGESFGKEIEARYQACIQQASPMAYEESLSLPNGKQWWYTKLVPIFVNGQVRQILGVSSEITQRKQQEQQVLDLLNEYEAIFHTTQTPMALWKVDQNGEVRLVRFNRVSETQNDMPTAQYAGKTLSEVFPGRTADFILAKNLECVREQKPVRFEVEIATPRGTGLHVTLLAPLVREGVTVGIVGSSIDVTEERRRLDELNRLYEEYASVFNTALTPMGIFAVDDDNLVRLIRFNAAYEQEVGFTTADYQHHTLYEILEEPYASRIDRYFQQCIRTQDSVVYSMEIQVKTKLGYFITQLAPIIENGRVVKIIGSSADITDLKRYQEDLQFERAMLIERVNERTGELRKAMQVKEEFLSTVSTNLRTPLTAILGFSELLRRIMDEDLTLFRYVGLIHENARQLSTMVDDMLSIANLENDQAELGYQFVNLEKFCAACIERVNQQSRDERVVIEYHFNNQQRMFWIDAPRIRQLILQILILGTKALPPESSILFTVSLKEDTAELHLRFLHRLPSKPSAAAEPHHSSNPHLMADQMKLVLIDHLIELLRGHRHLEMKPGTDAILEVSVPLLPENHAIYTKPSDAGRASIG